ncbi:MAG: NAD(P)H-dependent oxidoreductase [Candidatus Bathyarchaeia archaeon]
MKEKIFILAFAGSLRRNSYNKALLKVASETVPKNAKIEIFELDGIPPFNQDMENQPPKKVKEFKAKIRKADAILIATPEYNYSIPGVLKNAIDWASRPYDDNALEGKPVAVMSASIGMLGGARAQYHLRQVFVALDMYPVNDPEVLVSYAHKKIDDQGNVHDKETIERIKHLVEALVEWTAKLKG